MKVTNMTSSNGNEVANQFLISGVTIELSFTKNSKSYHGNFTGNMFQSYFSNIAFVSDYMTGNNQVFLDERYWNYSRTTGKYRNQFLGENIAETRKKIDSGEYILCNLN